MLNTAGMTGAGIERKATARALFSKLQYLAGRIPFKIRHTLWLRIGHKVLGAFSRRMYWISVLFMFRIAFSISLKSMKVSEGVIAAGIMLF